MVMETAHSAWRRSGRAVIDAHTHLQVAHLDQAVRLMDQNGIQMMIDISGGCFGEPFDKLLAGFRRYPGRFAAFTGVDWQGFGEPGWAARECEQVSRAVEAGAVGVKLHKALGLKVRDTAGRLVPVDDERLAPLFARAAGLGVVVAMHIADPKAFFRPFTPANERWDELEHNPDWWFGDRSNYCYDWWRLIRQLEKVVRRHPETTIMGVHFGCAAEEVGYVADVLRDNPHYIVDVAARVGELGRHDAAFVREVFREFQDRILFGTDLGVLDNIMLGAPQGFEPSEADVVHFYDAHWRFFETGEEQIAHPTPIQGRWRVDAVNLPGQVLEKFYYGNARRYLLSV